MNTSLVKNNSILKENLDQAHFFEALLETLTKADVINMMEFQKIQGELLALLSEEVGHFNHGESSSVKVELAESIMASIYYTLSIYFKELEPLDTSKEHLTKIGIKGIFEAGKKRIEERVLAANELLQLIMSQKLNTANYAYNDTVSHGLTLFFKEYDSNFAAQETPGSIDYFLFFTETQATGIEYMEIYLMHLYLENTFCLKFNPLQVELLLSDYDKDYEHLLINIFEIVLLNALALAILDKDIVHLELYKEEVQDLQEKLQGLTKAQLQEKLQLAAKKCLKVLGIEDSEVIDYVHKATDKLVELVKVKLEISKIDKVFIPVNEDRKAIIHYADDEPMNQEAFKALWEEIRSCEAVGDKVKLMREQIHCLTDLMDLLEAECFYEEEFIAVFEALEPLEIALLVKAHPMLEIKESLMSESFEKEWHDWLSKYLNQIDEVKRKQIMSISEQIKL